MNKRIRGAEANSATLSYKSEKNQPRGLKDHQKGPIDSTNRERREREKRKKKKSEHRVVLMEPLVTVSTVIYTAHGG